MTKNWILGAIGAAALLAATGANAATRTFDLSASEIFGGNAGVITATDINSTTIEISVDLTAGWAFQNVGNNQVHNSLTFNLDGLPAVTYSFLDPLNGTIGGGSSFSGHGPTANGFGGQGWSDPQDYAVQVVNTSGPGELWGLGGELLTFRLSVGSGTLDVSKLFSESMSPNGVAKDIFFVADLSGPPLTGSQRNTGPVGAVERITDPCVEHPTDPGCGNPNQGVPEPATWAMMVLGFLGAGTMIRRRRYSLQA